MVGKVVVSLVAFVALVILIVAMSIGWTFLELRYFGPREHERNTEKAAISNQLYWETGLAVIYTIEINVEVNNVGQTVLMDVVCVPKTVTENVSLKNGSASSQESVRNFSPRQLQITISGNYQIEFNTNYSCSTITRDAEEKGIPFELSYLRLPELLHIEEPIMSCRGNRFDEELRWGSIRASRIKVVSREIKPVRDVLTREEYGPADGAIIRSMSHNEQLQSETIDIPLREHLRWSRERMCWSYSPASNCSTAGQTICEPTL